MISCIAPPLASPWLIRWFLVIRVNKMGIIAGLCEVRSANSRRPVPSLPLLGSLPQLHYTLTRLLFCATTPPPPLLSDPKVA